MINLVNIGIFLKIILAAFFIIISASNSWGADTFDPATGHLTIPTVVVGDGTKTTDTISATDVVVTVGGLISSGESYLLAERTLTLKPDFYDTSLNQLLIPQVVVNERVYEDVVITLGDVVSHTGDSQPWMSPSHSGAESLQPFNYFFADDIPQIARDRWELAIEEAADYFGRYARTEIYVVGKDDIAMNKLSQQWCEMRSADGHQYDNYCQSASLGKEGALGFELYRQKGVEGQFGAGINGAAGDGYHLMISAYPAYFDPDDNEQFYGWKMPIHEYFHITQLAHTARYEQRNTELMGPVWFIEGTASFMTDWLFFKLQQEGTLQILDGRAFDLIDDFARRLRHARSWWAEGNRLAPEGDFDLFGNVGPWTTAYLLHSIDDIRALEDKFYPVLRELGFEGAFEQTFNMSVQEFEVLFDQFMNKPVEEQLEILPGWSAYESKDQAIADASLAR